MLTIHHLRISQSERIIWLCEELGLPYTLVSYDRDPKTMMGPPEYKALHPLGTAPIITDGAVILAETGAIFDYILALHGNGGLVPAPGDPDYIDYLFWYHYANGSMMPGITSDLISKRYSKDPEWKPHPGSRGEKAYALVEERLGEAPYFAGDRFTLADIMMGFPLTKMRHFSGRDMGQAPNTLAYLARIAERPAYRVAMAADDPA